MDKILGSMEAAFDRPGLGFIACTQVLWEKLIRIREPRAKLLVNGAPVVTENEEEAFVILNPESKEVMIWSLDACHLCADTTTRRCDAVFFNQDVLAFLELKLHSTSKLASTIDKNRTEAVDQLASGWAYFKRHYGEDKALADFAEIIAIRCVPPSYPRLSAKGIAALSRFTITHGIEFLEAHTFRLP